MKNGVRKAGVLCGAAFASALLATTTATHAAADSSTLIIGGIWTPSLSNTIMGRILGGKFQGQELVSVEWPAEARPFTGLFSDTLTQSVNTGVESLTNQIGLALDRLDKDADGNYLSGEKVTVVGLSAGNLVVDDVMRNLAAEANAPSADVLNFYTVEDTTRQRPQAIYNPFLNYTFQPPPVTQYDLVTVTGEYDGFADFPQRWWNLVAVANAVLGEIFVHVPVMFDNLADVPEEYITVTENDRGGTTTDYFVPQPLPLVVVFPFLRPFEAGLRAIVDAGYTRNDPDIAQTDSEDAVAVAADVASGEQEVAPGDGELQSADVEAGAGGDGSEGDVDVVEDVSLDDEAGAVAGDAVGALAGQVSGGDDNDARTEEDIAGQSEQAVADEVTETGATEAEAAEAQVEADEADAAEQTESGAASAEAAGEAGTDGGPAADADATESEPAAAE